MIRARTLRDLFARREDPYAGGDLENAQRLASVLWGLIVVLVVCLLPTSPPREPTVASGWVITGVLLVLGVILVDQNRRRRIGNWRRLLVSGYGIVTGIGLMQWLAADAGEPYQHLILLPVMFVAATQPLRQIVAFLGFVLLVMVAPFVYGSLGSTQVAASAASMVIWCAGAAGINLLMSGVREQRLSHAAEEARAREEARIDSLTGLHNRRAFDEQLVAEVARARRLDLPLTVAMVDIENFKQVNDRWSYGAGDRCLCEVAEAVRDNLRQPDLCFRWGGDEFALILSGTEAEETDPIAERIQAEVARACARPDGSALKVRFAVVELRDGISPNELTEMAGMALTASKLEAAH